MPNTVHINILKIAKAPQEYIDAAVNFLCTSCEHTATSKQAAFKVACTVGVISAYLTLSLVEMVGSEDYG